MAPIISCIARVETIFPVEEPVTQYSLYGSGVTDQSEVPPHKCWHPQSERERPTGLDIDHPY